MQIRLVRSHDGISFCVACFELGPHMLSDTSVIAAQKIWLAALADKIHLALLVAVALQLTFAFCLDEC